jgi:acyl-CoA synthetase (AMP-forming)/AMP-acid ligase II
MSEIVDRFRRILRDAPDRELVHVPLRGASLTAHDIWTCSLHHRRALDRLGLGRDDLLIVAIGNHAAAFPLWLACLEAGIAIMPVDAGVTPVEIGDLARRFGARTALLAQAAAAGATLGGAENIGDGIVAVTVDGVEPRPDLCRGAAALKLTSGSTGLPKATFTTERELVLDTEHIVQAMDIRPEHTQIGAIPLSHAYGLGNLLITTLVQGSPIVLREGFVPHALALDARTYSAHVFPAVPFMFEHFLTAPPQGGWPPTLTKLISAGARLEPATVRRFYDAFGIKIHSFYGTSETGGIAFDQDDEVRQETTVGHPMPGVRIVLRPHDGAPPDGGRVHVSGDAVAARYAGEPPADGHFIDGGFLTGDFGRFDDEGRLVLTGRVSLFINVAGRKVQPEEVEQVLRAMPAIADVRVLGAPDASRGQQIVACVVPAGLRKDVLAIRQFCAARLAAYKLPRQIVWLDRIPLTDRGKTDRLRLEALVREHLARTPETGML